jgi:hypothetical protein
METIPTEAPGYERDTKSLVNHATDNEYKEFLKQRAANRKEKSLQDQVKILTNRVHLVERQLAELLQKCQNQ